MCEIKKNTELKNGPCEYVCKKETSKGESECKRVLEDLFKKKFITVRPDFLKNPKSKRNLELDCYNHDLKLAVEYNGIQHYHWPAYKDQSLEEFKTQVSNDQLKKDLCKKNGIKLIIVPYTVPLQNIKSYIIEKVNFLKKN